MRGENQGSTEKSNHSSDRRIFRVVSRISSDKSSLSCKKELEEREVEEETSSGARGDLPRT
jgi:hypothetical protein